MVSEIAGWIKDYPGEALSVLALCIAVLIPVLLWRAERRHYRELMWRDEWVNQQRRRDRRRR
jgi:hypothetical protein